MTFLSNATHLFGKWVAMKNVTMKGNLKKKVVYKIKDQNDKYAGNRLYGVGFFIEMIGC